MTHALATRLHDFTRSPVRPGALRRGLIAGGAWGIAMGLIVTAVGAFACDGICLTDAAISTALAVVAGIATVGPLAAFGARVR
jgi:hypothetical protein